MLEYIIQKFIFQIMKSRYVAHLIFKIDFKPGKKGLDYIIKNHDWDILADSLLKKFENLVDNKK